MHDLSVCRHTTAAPACRNVQVRGVVGETEELAHRAKDRVASDWEATKQGTRRMLDESSAARRYEAEHPPPKARLPPCGRVRWQ